MTAAFGQSLPEMRMTPVEMNSSSADGNQIGGSRLPGVHTKVLFGDPSRHGFYSILLFVPAHTTIAKVPLAGNHRGHPIVTV